MNIPIAGQPADHRKFRWRHGRPHAKLSRFIGGGPYNDRAPRQATTRGLPKTCIVALFDRRVEASISMCTIFRGTSSSLEFSVVSISF
jgi:hypothetical protein